MCIDIHQCCIAGHAGATFDVTYGSHTRIHTSRETDAELTSADFPPMTIEVQDYTDCRLLPQGVEAEQIAAQLRLQFDPQVVSQEARRLVLHDTFAWQLWFAGLVLCRIDQSAMLCHRDRLSPEEALVHCPADTDNGGALPKFWWDWDDANMRDALAGVIGLRAVRPVADILVQGQKINVRNGDAKTIARVVLERFVPSDHKSPERPPQAPVPRSPNSCALGICRVAAVRGYDDEHATVCETLSHGGLPWMDVSPLDLILEQSGCRPRKWSNKADCPVSSDLPAREATRRIAAASLRIVRRCEAGVIDDIDTEFLHDYRVNLRRVRSLLKLVGGVYPSETTQLLLNDLRDFARTTNRLRDLDVYLLHRTDYIKLLPPHQAQSLDWMFDDLSAERKLEQQAVAKHLQSDTYRWSIDRLEQIFQQDRWWPVTANSHLPIAALSSPAISRRFRKIRKMSPVVQNGPAERVHDLRLHTKKLRYLLELFAGAYPKDGVGPLVKRLKSLQNALGRFNDLDVQQQALRNYVDAKSAAGTAPVELVMAVGSLLGVLYNQQQALRGEINERLRKFTSHKTRELVRQLTFEPAPPGVGGLEIAERMQAA